MKFLLFADDVVPLASPVSGLQLSLDRSAAECEVVGIRISSSKSGAMLLGWKNKECFLLVREEIRPKVEEFKYIGVLLMS